MASPMSGTLRARTRTYTRRRTAPPSTIASSGTTNDRRESPFSGVPLDDGFGNGHLVRPLARVVAHEPGERGEAGRERDLQHDVAEEPGQLPDLAEHVLE